MNTLEEALALIPDEPVKTINDKLIIDPNTREILVPNSEIIFGVENDGNAERKYFSITDELGNNIKASECGISVVYRNAAGSLGKYVVSDKKLTNGNVEFSWEVSADVAAFKGTVYFIVSLTKSNSTGKIINDFNTTIAKGEVLEGLEYEPGAEEKEKGEDFVASLEVELKRYFDDLASKIPQNYLYHFNAESSLDGIVATTFENGSISTTDGSNLDGTSYKNQHGRSDFIKVDENETIYFDKTNSTVPTVYIIGYDSNKTFVRTLAVQGGNHRDIPAGIGYIRFRCTLGNTIGDLSALHGFVIYRKKGILYNELNKVDTMFIPKGVRQTAWRGCTFIKLDGNEYYTRYAVNNSWQAYHMAVKQGFDMLWLAGIRYSSDGVPYVHHDATLSTGETFSQCTSTFLDNYSLDVSSVTDEVKALWDTNDLSVPRLEKVIRYCLVNKMRIGIRVGAFSSNITSSDWTTLKALLTKYGLTEDIVISADESRCDIARQLFPKCHVQLDSTLDSSTVARTEARALELIEAASKYGGSVSVNIYIDNALTSNVMNVAHQKGVKVFAVCREIPNTSNVNLDKEAINSCCPDYIISHAMLDIAYSSYNAMFELENNLSIIGSKKTFTYPSSDEDGTYGYHRYRLVKGHEYEITSNVTDTFYFRRAKTLKPSLQSVDTVANSTVTFTAQYDTEWIVYSITRSAIITIVDKADMSVKIEANKNTTEENKKRLDQFVTITPSYLDYNSFQLGARSEFNSDVTPSTTRATTKSIFFKSEEQVTVTPTNGVKLFVYADYGDHSGWLTTPYTFKANTNYTVVYAYVDNATITDIADLMSKFEVLTEYQLIVSALKNNINPREYFNKKVSILGDSLSTFEGYTYPGNRCRYPQSDLLTNVNDTYWMKLINDLNMTLGVNESWAGSLVSNTQSTDSGDMGPNRNMASQTRINHLGENGTPDIIIVNGGTNDIGNSVEIGTFNYENPMNYTEGQIASLPVDTFANAYRTMLIRLQKKYPTSKIVVLLPNYTTSYYTPQKADEYCEVIKEACDYLGVKWKDMRASGITIFNRGTYLPDGIHYNALGMSVIEKNIKKFLLYDFAL